MNFQRCSMVILLAPIFFAIAILYTPGVNAAHSTSDHDVLASYVTRPELKHPLFNVSVHDPNAVTPGYFFLAPYIDLEPVPLAKTYRPCQVGPLILDGMGNLVWSGACLFDHRDVFDFRPVLSPTSPDGSPSPIPTEISLILNHCVEHRPFMQGAGISMNSSYQATRQIPAPFGSKFFNIHEFKILPEHRDPTTGRHRNATVLVILDRPQLIDVSGYGLALSSAWVHHEGIQEIDLDSGQVLFEWWTLDRDHLSLSESKIPFPGGPGDAEHAWDILHLNSVDKHPTTGDYLISARHSDTIYLISHIDGSIIWRLCGSCKADETGDFVRLDDFTFSSQHDARFRQVESEESNTIIISLFDNAAGPVDPGAATASVSSALILDLDVTSSPKTARLLKRFPRPDGRLTYLRGNAQILPPSTPGEVISGNVFVGWSNEGYVSEFTSDGRCVLEARFRSLRMVTYRAYKSDFVGYSSEPIALKSSAYGVTPHTATTVLHVSWNGATQVREWKFYGRDGPVAARQRRQGENEGQFHLITSCVKTGFETQCMADGFAAAVFAEAIDSQGEVLGRSEVEWTTAPDLWADEEALQRELEVPIPPFSGSTQRLEGIATNLAAGGGGGGGGGGGKGDTEITTKSSSFGQLPYFYLTWTPFILLGLAAGGISQSSRIRRLIVSLVGIGG